jgi:2-polyprenyl-3-methyl-5-hydroxy-6-metoxy-1,4-benzoquinol methylase
MNQTQELSDNGMLEEVTCYLCGSGDSSHFTEAWDDLSGKPGTFHFVRCNQCGLVYQNPRIKQEFIGMYYDDEYIAHRKKKNWGLMTPLYNWAMDTHDRQKSKLVARYTSLTNSSKVLDIGCGAGTFLLKMHSLHGSGITGVDFKNLSALPGFDLIDFRHGPVGEQNFPAESFDLVTMWHYLEHDYAPVQTLEKARRIIRADGTLIIEVPRLDSVTFKLYRERWPGLQAPQHTVLFNKQTLLETVQKAGFVVQDYLPYGAFPAYFYLFCGLAFKFLKGRGLNLSKAVYPYFAGQLLALPVLLFEKQLNLAMQTVICRKPQ